MWEELRECFHLIKNDTNYRAIVVSGEGKCFSAGIDRTILFNLHA